MQIIPSGEDCFICGGELEIHTDADQVCPCIYEYGNTEDECDHSFKYVANDGDEAICPECGAKGYVSVDDIDAHISYDEMNEHNTACYERYENKSKGTT